MLGLQLKGIIMNEVVKVKVAQFDRDMQLILGDNYLDTIIYGSNSLDDFHIGKSDIDFCVVVQNDLSDSEIEKIINLHEVYRNRNDIEIAFFEGYYYPRKALIDLNAKITGYKVAADRTMWRKMDKFLSNCFELIQFSTNGIRIRSKDFSVVMPSNSMILGSMKKGLEYNRKWVGDLEVPSYLIIQYAARCIYFIDHGKIGSKAKACEYFASKYPGNAYFLECGKLRKPFDEPSLGGKYPNHQKDANFALDYFEKVLNMIENGDLTIASTMTTRPDTQSASLNP